MKGNVQTESLSEEQGASRTDEYWNGYRVRYDKAYLMETMRKLGISDEVTADLTTRAVACYVVKYGKTMSAIYEHLAESTGVGSNAIAMRIKRGLNEAEMKGSLKYIDNIVSGAVYDYDYGYTAKEFVALLASNICDLNKVEINKL